MPLRISIVTFNDNERAAVEQFLNDLALGAPSRWARLGTEQVELRDLVDATRGAVLRHLALQAQGNVVAAAKLAEASAELEQPDFVVFYGCAGAIDPGLVGHAFLVGSVSYVSLGTVAVPPGGPPGAEVVTLKNKWLSHTDPHEVGPLLPVRFQQALNGGTLDLRAATSLSTAHVVATDKVIKVGAGTAPAPFAPGPPHPVYTKGDWTYGEALAFVADHRPGTPILVDMESYGIGAIAKALKLDDRVVIVRIVTDDLRGHGASGAQQAHWLLRGRIVLARLILAMVNAYLGL